MVKTHRNLFIPDYVSPPGDTLEEILEERGMSQAELAERMGRTTKTINEIIKGKAPITPETALQLERVLNIPAQFWNSREQQYREALARKDENKRLESWIEWMKQFPIRAMVKLGWVKKHNNKLDQLRAILHFFGIASPEQWETIWLSPDAKAAFRKSLAFSSDPAPLSAWLRYGEIAARERNCNTYNQAQFKAALHQIRSLTVRPPSVFEPSLIQLCCRSGVAVVLTPEIPRARVCGATRWLSPDLALVQLSLRYKTDDHFWFTFFHEAGHILLHGKREVFLEDSGDLEQQKQKEDEANQFASNFLIPNNELQAFIDRGERSRSAVLQFAKELGIAPGIVVGQLQHKGFLPYSYLNDLKVKFKWVEAVEE